jgi:hypothetical protein
VFNLGVSNSVDAKTTLTGASTGAQLQVTNTNATAGAFGLGVTSKSSTATGFFDNTGAGTGLFARTGGAGKAAVYAHNTGGGPAGIFVVNAGVSPFTVNSSTKVGSLNADLLDGLDNTALQKRVTGTCSVGTAVRVVNSDGTVACQAVGAAAGGSPIAGVVTFVDPADTSGFIGMGGEANLAPSVADAGSPVPAAGTLSGFRARLTAGAAGNVVFTLFVNGAATSVTCTVPAVQTTCADGAHTVALAAGDTVAVGVTNASGLLRHVRWSARVG